MNIPTTEEQIKIDFNIQNVDDVALKGLTVAKIHCIEEARVISEKATIDTVNMGSSEFQTIINKSSIIDAYDLDNIQ